MKTLFDAAVWPNYMRNVVTTWGNDYGGRPFFSEQEKLRRHRLVQEQLEKKGCDLLIVQNYFPPSTMGVHTSLYWLACDNYMKNTYTLILPARGELQIFHGTKTSEADLRTNPYLTGEDMSSAIQGARKIAYDGLGLITHGFYEYLMETCPGAELVDFSQELAFLRAVKSEEEYNAVCNTVRIQDAMFHAAPLYLRPGRTVHEIYSDIFKYLLDLGGDPSQMPKILIFLGKNTQCTTDAPMMGTRPAPPDYRITREDYIELTLETPGCGGYYAERSRHFFFQEPIAELKNLFSEALTLQEYQIGLYRPGLTMKELRETMNEYKHSAGSASLETGHDWRSTEIRGMGNSTVCRPLVQYDWEWMSLTEGMVFDSIHKLAKYNRSMTLHETVYLRREGAEVFGTYPQKLTVL